MSNFVNIPAAEWRALNNRIRNMENMLQSLTVTGSRSAWVTKEEAKRLLNIKSDKALYNLRSSGAIEYSAANPRNLLYKRSSIENYLKSKSSAL